MAFSLPLLNVSETTATKNELPSFDGLSLDMLFELAKPCRANLYIPI
jgi:hypothetical protein